MVAALKQETVNPVAVHIGKRIKSLRRLRGMKQDALARDVGYSSHPAIAQFENGLAVPSVDKALEIARVLGVGVGELLGDDSVTSTRTFPESAEDQALTPARQSWLEGWARSRPKKEIKVVEEFLSGLLDSVRSTAYN